MTLNAGAPPIPYGASFPLLHGLDLSGPLVTECNDHGTVTTNQTISFATNSCQKFTTATTALTYTLSTTGVKTDRQVEIDSYITGQLPGRSGRLAAADSSGQAAQRLLEVVRAVSWTCCF